MRECYWIDDNTSPEDAASVAIQVSSDEWIEFNDHFFQTCCDCGLTHRVEIHDKAVGTREVQFVRLDAHTEQMRLRFKRENYAGTYEIERLRAEVARLTAEQDAISANIGGNEYLDPPDGGNVSLAEQVRRMRADILALREQIASLGRGACGARVVLARLKEEGLT